MSQGCARTASVSTWLPIVGLALAAFMFNTSEFIPVGLLTDIAGTFALSEAQAGMMISVYAWGVMILSLPLMVAASRLDPRRLLLLVIAVFMAGQVASAVAPTFVTLVLARLLVAAAHAIFWSIASPLATRIADPSQASRAMGLVVTGSSIAMIAGMPLGRVIGLAVGWRATFSCVAAVACAVLVMMTIAMPRVERTEPFTVRQLPDVLRNRALMVIYAVTILVATGYYTGYSYIEPFMQRVADMPDTSITACLTVFGVAGLVGSFLFSRLYDNHRIPFVRIMVFGVAASLLLLGTAGAASWAAFAVCALWGLSATAFNVAFQAEIIHDTPAHVSAVAMSIFSGLFNLGIGCGTWLGGQVVDGLGINLIGVVGGLVALAGFVVCFVSMRKGKSANATA